MKYKNYYEILGVNRKSSLQEIKLSYRKLAKKYHPDANKEPGAEIMFKDINEAYDILTTDEKRRKYFMEKIKDRQVIITCTDKEFIKDKESCFFNVNKGSVRKE